MDLYEEEESMDGPSGEEAVCTKRLGIVLGGGTADEERVLALCLSLRCEGLFVPFDEGVGN